MDDIEARFWSKVDKRGKDECWPWLASIVRAHDQAVAYGWFRGFGGKMTRAHRVAYTLARGDIPNGLMVRHTCDNGLCCNPDHLVVGTYLDNINDRQERGRQARGERVGTAKLSSGDVRSIRQRIMCGESPNALAKEFGVSYRQIWCVNTYRSWGHI